LIYGIGTDIIETSRIQAVMERDLGFKDKIFSPGEISYCESKRNKYQHYAARFSAKEAFMKALGTGWRDGIRFVEIEVIHDPLGKPMIALSGRAREIADRQSLSAFHVTLSHIKDIATATVIIENP
jgi:holo-[acyl-carrier protein] synthase